MSYSGSFKKSSIEYLKKKLKFSGRQLAKAIFKIFSIKFTFKNINQLRTRNSSGKVVLTNN